VQRVEAAYDDPQPLVCRMAAGDWGDWTMQPKLRDCQPMPEVVEKVTAFVTRPSGVGIDLLLFEHPFAGIQIPAGTVDKQEAPKDAVLREVAEETGLTSVAMRRYLGHAEHRLPEGQSLIAKATKVYARPDTTSFDWAYLRTGIQVTVGRTADGFSQVTYTEFDQEPEPQYITMSIMGWVPDEVLADTVRRHFFHMECRKRSEERWTVFADNHLFTLFWAPLSDLPKLVHPQDEWIEFLCMALDNAEDGDG
jgi:8-oxo-dGTP pyrophosphatase MutT (NUDIX family)